MLNGSIVVIITLFLVVTYCYLAHGRRQNEVIRELYQKLSGMASGKDEK